MKQPSKHFLKDQLALAADEIIFRRELLQIHEDAWKEAMEVVHSSGRTLWGVALGLGLLSGLLIWWLL